MADTTIASIIDSTVAKITAATEAAEVAPETLAAPAVPATEAAAPAPEAAPAQARAQNGQFVSGETTKVKLSSGEELSIKEIEAIAAGHKASEVLKSKLDEQSAGVRQMYENAQKMASEAKAERAAAERERQAIAEALRRQDENGGPLDIRDHLRGVIENKPQDVELTEQELDRRVEKRVSDILASQSRKSREQYLNENFDEWVKTTVEADPQLKPRSEQYGWYVTGQIRKALAERGMTAHDMRDGDLKALIKGAVAEASLREEKLRAQDLGATLDAHAGAKKNLPVTPTNAGTSLPQMPSQMKFDVKKTFAESRSLDEAFEKMADQVKSKFDEFDRLSKDIG